ncbi:MAG TPA: DinB family protein [Thermoanaerobaculia bacterium]|nr:DinB family protein [Thermoanaerobaculia bacterium]
MTKQLLAVLAEGMEGPRSELSYFLDSGAGLRQTLGGLSAEEASRVAGGNSVAAHAHHILFSFEAFGAYIRGDRTLRDWSQSWSVSTVSSEDWTKLQEDLSREYSSLREAVRGAADDDALRGAVAAVTHLAYHIGAIRQKLTARGV